MKKDPSAVELGMAGAQLAILDAIPVHIALLDAQGVIIAVNQSWKRFASTNVLQTPAYGVGCNYLEVCEGAARDCSGEAAEAGRGLRGVLQGELREFSLEYPCHSPTEKRWFRLLVTRMQEQRGVGAMVMHINITELKETELKAERMAQEALDGRQQLDFALDAASLGDWSLDLVTNRAHRSLRHDHCFGYTQAVPVWGYDTFLAHIQAVDRDRVDACFKKAMTGLGDYEAEFRTTWPDGSVHWLWTKGRFCFDDKGRPLRVAGIVSDITERKQTELALRDRETEFRTLTEALPQIVWVARADGWSIYYNQQWMDYTGMTLVESLGYGWNKPFHPDDQHRAWEAWQHAKANGCIYSLECRLRRADGKYQWWLVRGVPHMSPTGEILKWFGTCTDIDESKRTQVRIAEQAALINESRDAIIVRDLNDHITFWSRGAERLYGWTAAEAIGRTLLELLKPELERFHEALGQVQREGFWNGEIQKATKDGTALTLDARWTLLRDAADQPKSILAIDTDITERKKIERQFLRAQRMESIGILAGGIAHDLNNLLAPITMGVDLLKLSEPNPKCLPIIDTIERSAKRGANLVKQVLSFARGVDSARVPLQIRHILREIESIAENSFPKNITIEMRVPSDLGLVMADPTQLNQVFLNLCVNARDAMPNGGRLELTANNIVIDAQYATLNRGVMPGQYVVIEVTDNGCGMPQPIIDRIFEPFFTTKEQGKGTGLGLSTVLGILRSHGGFVNVYSELGMGSTFKVYLPVQGAGLAEAPAGLVEIPLPRGNGELIMVVDDEASVLDITKQTLQAFGYRTVTAEDGAQAIGLYAVQRNEIALVITDMMMPVMDGPVLINALRRINSQVRVIAASGLNANANLAQASTAGVTHFLAKPYSADALLRLVRKALTDAGSRPPM